MYVYRIVVIEKKSSILIKLNALHKKDDFQTVNRFIQIPIYVYCRIIAVIELRAESTVGPLQGMYCHFPKSGYVFSCSS